MAEQVATVVYVVSVDGATLWRASSGASTSARPVPKRKWVPTRRACPLTIVAIEALRNER
jgi:hypothetical protein